MTATNRHFGLKLVAIALVVTIFATLLPQRQVFWAEDSTAPQAVLPTDTEDLIVDFTEEATANNSIDALFEAVAYGRTPSLKETVKVGVISGVTAGVTQYVGQELGLIQCFIAGTIVAAKEGPKKIEDIQVGDLVWATDPNTGETELKEVKQLFRNETDEWIHIKVNDEEIVCTPNHPFWVPVKGWTKACHLRAGDRLQLLNGEYVIVEQIQHELLENPETTYNFEVEDLHTYFVGESGVLAHNKCVAQKGGLKAIVNENREFEAPHAHILKNGKRVAVVDAAGEIIKGKKTADVVKFVTNFKSEIVEGIKKFYPKSVR